MMTDGSERRRSWRASASIPADDGPRSSISQTAPVASIRSYATRSPAGDQAGVRTASLTRPWSVSRRSSPVSTSIQ